MSIEICMGLFGLLGFLIASFYIYWCLLEITYELPDFKYRKNLPNAFIFLIICNLILVLTIFGEVFF